MTLAVHGVLASLAYVAAFLLRFDFQPPSDAVTVLVATLPLVCGVRILFSQMFDLASARWRYASTADVQRLTGATIAGTTVLFALTWGVPGIPAVPRSILLLEAALTMLFTAGVWISYRTGFERLRQRGGGAAPVRVLVVGAGEAGQHLVREMLRSRFGYRPILFVDDDATKRDVRIHGVPVLGVIEDIPALVRRYSIQRIVVAIPQASAARLREIVAHCEQVEARVEVLPGIEEVLAGKIRIGQLRELQIEDLLGREPVALRLRELAADLGGRSVLITGAAGSIGSELARQVALHAPRRLLCLDQSETALFNLERELRAHHPTLNMTFVVGDVVDTYTVAEVLSLYQPSHIFHAAAYKHVGMMQHNVREAVRNNTIGTWRLADAAGRAGVAKFVLVSTDKAVRPTSTMGASKRLAECVIQHLQGLHPRTHFSAVRFGNVLGSNGSVIQIFREQIAAGRPLTVTHREATRFFMTIPEAVQLILQASLLPETRGQIAMLEMGEPVRIMDLARNVLRISGLPSREGETIVVTGLRPGEKLHEELVGTDETVLPTSTPRVRIVRPSAELLTDVGPRLRMWDRAFAEGRSEDVARALRMIFPSLELDQTELSVAV